MVPLATHEVRWFLDGSVSQYPELKHWFETSTPISRPAGLGPPEWRGRLDDQPDVYLLIPGGADLGIKWREGQLQIKGRVAALGVHVFAGRHHGQVERWIKWSYSKVPERWRQFFAAGPDAGIVTAAVRKIRALRKLQLEPFSGGAHEVDPESPVDRGIGLELTDLELNGSRYCTLALEAFPDDSGMHLAFDDAAGRFLDGLRALDLTAARSLSYPAWLQRLMLATQGY